MFSISLKDENNYRNIFSSQFILIEYEYT